MKKLRNVKFNKKKNKFKLLVAGITALSTIGAIVVWVLGYQRGSKDMFETFIYDDDADSEELFSDGEV